MTVPAGRRAATRAATLLCASLLLAACEFGEEAAPPAPQPLPPEVCARSKEAVDGAEQTGAIVLTTPTAGIVPQEAWFRMAPSGRDALLSAIALAATCADAPRLEQEVVIHSETGTVLARRTVQTSFSMTDALGS